MDYVEEQKSEIEALESIYYGDFEIISVKPYKFSIPIKTEDYDAESNTGLSCNLVVTYTPKYPDEEPIVEIENAENFEGSFEFDLLKHLDEQVGFACFTWDLGNLARKFTKPSKKLPPKPIISKQIIRTSAILTNPKIELCLIVVIQSRSKKT